MFLLSKGGGKRSKWYLNTKNRVLGSLAMKVSFTPDCCGEQRDSCTLTCTNMYAWLPKQGSSDYNTRAHVYTHTHILCLGHPSMIYTHWKWLFSVVLMFKNECNLHSVVVFVFLRTTTSTPPLGEFYMHLSLNFL